MTRPTVLVDIGFTATTTGDYWHIGDETRGKIGTAAIGPDELWTDVSTDAREVTIRRDSNRAGGPIIRYDAGRLGIRLRNETRAYDPTNLAGPHVVGGVPQVTPMRPARVRAEHLGVTYDLIRAFADSWTVSFVGGVYAETQLQATDGTKVLAAVDRAASAAVGAGEDTGARIDRILTSAGWPTADRMIATGDSTLQATTLSGAALAEAQNAAEAEAGEFYIDGAGRVFFRNRRAILADARSTTSQATFGTGPGELPYQDVTVEYDDAQLYNVARITRDGGSEQTVTNAASVAAYLTRTYPRSGLPLETDAEALNYAGWVVYQSKDPELRFSQITIRPGNSDSDVEDLLYIQILSRQIGDRITVIVRPAGGGDPIERDVFIRGIQHRIKPGLDWETVWTLQSATKYAFWTIGDPILGQVGYNAIAY